MKNLRISGENIFFNFIEKNQNEIDSTLDLVRQIKDNELDGFIIKNVFSEEEVKSILQEIKNTPEKDGFSTPSGLIFPAPFAIIDNAEERLDTYFEKLQAFDEQSKNGPLRILRERVYTLFKTIANSFTVSVPVNKVKKLSVAPGNIRLLYPNKGGLYVHCGNHFKSRSLFYYSLLENDIDMDFQLSYFVMLQHPDKGGELTIYDMLWDTVKTKDYPENNDFVIDDNGQKIFIKDVPFFKVHPLPGDVLIFSGGPIWHRVEDIIGTKPRITFGGFLNYSKDGKELFYWS